MSDSTSIIYVSEEGRAERRQRWWARCRQYRLDALRKAPDLPKLHAKTIATYRRISELHVMIGEALDEMGAPQRIAKWVAWSPDYIRAPRNVIQQARFETVASFYHEAGRWPLYPELAMLAEDVAVRVGVLPLRNPTPEAEKSAALEALIERLLGRPLKVQATDHEAVDS